MPTGFAFIPLKPKLPAFIAGSMALFLGLGFSGCGHTPSGRDSGTGSQQAGVAERPWSLATGRPESRVVRLLVNDPAEDRLAEVAVRAGATSVTVTVRERSASVISGVLRRRCLTIELPAVLGRRVLIDGATSRRHPLTSFGDPRLPCRRAHTVYVGVRR